MMTDLYKRQPPHDSRPYFLPFSDRPITSNDCRMLIAFWGSYALLFFAFVAAVIRVFAFSG